MAAAPADDHDALLASFMGVTNTADVSHARFLLESAGWQLETALELALDQSSPAPEGLRRRAVAQPAPAPPPMPQTPPAAPAAPAAPQVFLCR